ncbi:chemotaxis protein CheW [Ramlibacter sp.]|uniref:chemotaxis protein CheW n=1 Tax=Ramlibacter sp. TaxID=1917967 RepID=UPI002D70F740|nr:chemotaxis protein CheW [Ramlibacter sp.]HYD75532.1 chemotaxis protein CheW [Ramlibacter sp.]
MKPGDEMDAALEASVLRQRARALARSRTTAQAGGVEMLDFSVAGHRCALELRWVREVRPLQDAVPLPGQPSVRLVQLRGRMLPVIDMPGLDADASDRSPAPGLLLVLGRHEAEFGVPITAVHGLPSVLPEEAVRRGQPLHDWRPDIVRGVTAAGLVVLDGERLLSLPGRSAATPPGPPVHHFQ